MRRTLAVLSFEDVTSHVRSGLICKSVMTPVCGLGSALSYCSVSGACMEPQLTSSPYSASHRQTDPSSCPDTMKRSSADHAATVAFEPNGVMTSEGSSGSVVALVAAQSIIS